MKIDAPPAPPPTPVPLTPADPTATQHNQRLTSRHRGTVKVTWPFVVRDSSTYPVIIGADLLSRLTLVQSSTCVLASCASQLKSSPCNRPTWRRHVSRAARHVPPRARRGTRCARRESESAHEGEGGFA